MKSRARINRAKRPRLQYKAQGEELNNHEPRMGVAKWKRRHKCHCEICGGRKSIAVSKVEDVEWKKEIRMLDTE